MDKRVDRPAVHRRLYGKDKQESMDWLVYLKQLSRKPRALKYTGIYKILPASIREWLEGVSPKKQSSALKLLAAITEKSGFDIALRTLENAIL